MRFFCGAVGLAFSPKRRAQKPAPPVPFSQIMACFRTRCIVGTKNQHKITAEFRTAILRKLELALFFRGRREALQAVFRRHVGTRGRVFRMVVAAVETYFTESCVHDVLLVDAHM